MRTERLSLRPVKALVETAEPLEVDSSCTRCRLADNGNKYVCMRAEGDPGGVLVIHDSPGKAEETRNRPFCSTPALWVRQQIKKNWSGPVAYDHAVRCRPVRFNLTPKPLAQCRGYLHRTILEAEPERILVFGTHAVKTMFGECPPLRTYRRVWGWLSDQTPAFYFPLPGAALSNRFLRRQLEEDIAWALRVDLQGLRTHIPWKKRVNYVEDKADAQAAFEELQSSKHLVFDCETSDALYSDRFQVHTVSVTDRDTLVTYVWIESALRCEESLSFLRRLLSSKSVELGGHNIDFDLHAAGHGLGIYPEGQIYCTRTVQKLLRSDQAAKLEYAQHMVGFGGGKTTASKALAKIHTACRNAKTESEMDAIGQRHLVEGVRAGEFAPEKFSYGLLPEAIRDPYCATDTISTALLWRMQERQMDRGLGQVTRRGWEKVFRPTVKALHRIERWGMHVDLSRLNALDREVTAQLHRAREVLKTYGDFDPESPKDTGRFLYKDLGLRPPSRTSTGQPSVDKEAMAALASQYEVAQHILTYRSWAKTKGTYIDGLRRFIQADGRIHCSFDPVGAESGRISSREPNLQNISKRTEIGKQLRRVFTAEPGWTMIQADYSQAEIRMACHLADDRVMLEAICSGRDFHLTTAQMISRAAWGIDPSTLTKESPERDKSKEVIFGLMYGMGDESLGRRLGVTKEEAGRIRKSVLSSYSSYGRWVQKCIQHALRNGYTYTYWDGEPAHYRLLSGIGADREESGKEFSVSKNGAANTPVQGSANYLNLVAASQVIEWIDEEGIPAKVTNLVHDSMNLEVRNDYVSLVCRVVKEIMESQPCGEVPLVADVEQGPSWAELEKVIF